jgi:glucose-6-phosphate 1-epimerase
MPLIISSNQYGQVSQNSINQDVSVIELEHATCRAKISLYGGQVLEWQPKHLTGNAQQPIFWLSKSAIFEQDKAIRGGIPLCWPWFGPLLTNKDENLGNHGFARQRQWQLDDIKIDESTITVILVRAGKGEHPAWQYDYQLKQTLVFGHEFEQSLAITNLSSESFEYTGALHSYFSVSHPENAHVPALSDLVFDDGITKELQQKSVLDNCVGSVDRIYYGDTPCKIIDKQWQRIIEVSSLNCSQWVFWNPGKDIASTMVDIHADGENEFFCLEAANTTNQKVAAHTTAVIGQKITVTVI